jgi:hypothetical protein
MKKKILLLTLLIVAFSALPVYAGAVGFNQWYEFGFGQATSEAFNGELTVSPTPQTTPATLKADDPDWTYTTVSPVGSRITVVDAFLYGDVFEVWIDGSAVGSTTNVANTGLSSGISNPDLALGDSGLSRGFFSAGPGAHSFTIFVTQNALNNTSGAAFFKVEECGIPVPPSVYLLGSGLLGLFGLRRKLFA